MSLIGSSDAIERLPIISNSKLLYYFSQDEEAKHIFLNNGKNFASNFYHSNVIIL